MKSQYFFQKNQNFGVGNTWNCLTEKADELIAGQYNNPSQLYHGLWIGISSWQQHPATSWYSLTRTTAWIMNSRWWTRPVRKKNM